MVSNVREKIKVSSCALSMRNDIILVDSGLKNGRRAPNCLTVKQLAINHLLWEIAKKLLTTIQGHCRLVVVESENRPHCC